MTDTWHDLGLRLQLKLQKGITNELRRTLLHIADVCNIKPWLRLGGAHPLEEESSKFHQPQSPLCMDSVCAQAPDLQAFLSPSVSSCVLAHVPLHIPVLVLVHPPIYTCPCTCTCTSTHIYLYLYLCLYCYIYLCFRLYLYLIFKPSTLRVRSLWGLLYPSGVISACSFLRKPTNSSSATMPSLQSHISRSSLSSSFVSEALEPDLVEHPMCQLKTLVSWRPSDPLKVSAANSSPCCSSRERSCGRSSNVAPYLHLQALYLQLKREPRPGADAQLRLTLGYQLDHVCKKWKALRWAKPNTFQICWTIHFEERIVTEKPFT